MTQQVIGVMLTLFPLVALAAAPDSARGFYDELVSARGLNPLATFVCFPDNQPDTFFIMGRSSQFETTLKAKGRLIDPALRDALKQAKQGELLYWQGFHKGVATDASMLDRGANASDWSYSFDEFGGKKASGKVTVRITWPTLRYKLVFSFKDVPSAVEYYGKCEPIPG